MPIFALDRSDYVDYEEDDAMVVRAADAAAARLLAAGTRPATPASPWLDPARSTCVPVPEAGPPEVILISNRGA